MTRFTLALLSAFLALPSCASPSHDARVVLDVVSEGVVVADNASAQAYTDHAHAALAAAHSMAEYTTAMAPYDDLERVLEVADAALRAADNAIDTWDHGGAQRWVQMVVCLIGVLENVSVALTAAGLPVPPELDAALDALAPFIGTCVPSTAFPPDPATTGGA